MGLLLVGTGCSSGSSDDGAGEDSDEVSMDEGGGGDGDFVVDSEEEDLLLDEEGGADKQMALAENTTGTDAGNDGAMMTDVSEAPVMESSGPVGSTSLGGGVREYSVKRGETLMLIAFKVYGDYTRWKEIRDMNPGVSYNNLSEGTNLKYNAPAQEFVWNPQGEPYLIQRGDTLGTISNDKYGASSRWKDVYNNNRAMIKDPNLIFAGFTLYYIPDREIASEL